MASRLPHGERHGRRRTRWQNRTMATDSDGDAGFEVVAESDVPGRQPDPAKFSGEVSQQEVLKATRPDGLRGLRFSYAPGARSAWHVHLGEQALVVTDGRGLIQWEGLPEPKVLGPGDWVHVQPGIPHWHGAAADSEFVHLAVTASGGTEWLGHVEDDEAGD